MKHSPSRKLRHALLLGFLPALSCHARDGVWTNPEAADLPPDFAFQGEYLSEGEPATGTQVISLGGGAFHAVVLPGGLPGAGWTGEGKILMDGALEDGKVVFKPADPPKNYLAKEPERFSATRQFPPAGHEKWAGLLEEGGFKLTTASGDTLSLEKTLRSSPTAGAEPPEEALVLFDGSGTDHWNGGRLADGVLHTDGKDIVTKEKFDNYTLHLEFMLPYRPEARGQGRGNSGVYHVDHYETQVLDSFGLEGLNNECGGVYTVAAPVVNMCYPPLTWQTYDVDFTNASPEGSEPARITVRHNGVVIHDNLEIPKPTGGARNEPIGSPGSIRLQGHGNPVQYRNIWIVKKN